MLVRVVASGHVCLINASDFNAAIHEDAAAEAKSEEKTAESKGEAAAAPAKKAKGGKE
jgi:hypothetical protein